MTTHDVALIPGDGIGTEVVEATVPVVEAVAERSGFEVETTRYDWSTRRYLDEGSMMPDDGLARLREHDATLLGAVGHPDVADHVTLNGLLLPIRKGLDLSVCLRPCELLAGVESPLRGYEPGDIDFLVYRENTEGQYADVGGREHVGLPNDVAVQSSVFTRRGCERVVRPAFEAASEREGRLTSVTKSNSQAYGMVFWDEMVEEIAADYPAVDVDRMLVDAASMELVRRPERYDVVVASNLFGDILTDVGAAVSGSMGLAPSANVDPEGANPGAFEPVHGSAPDIAGDGVANPIACLRSAAMLLDDVGETAAAERLDGAVRAVLADESAPRTPDLGGSAGTDAVATAVRDRL